MRRILAYIFSIFLFLNFNSHAFSETQNSEISSEEQSVIEAALIAEAIKIMEKNIDASKRESGEIDKLIRALSGVSVKDIKKYGICGGPNSEVRKLFGSLCKDIK